MQLKTFKYRLYPTPAQEKRLELCLNAARNWYNMCIAERKYSYELEGRSVGLYEQLRLVKRYKAAFRQFKDVHSHIFQVATADCDKAFKAFFRRTKAKETAGYPRFKGYWHFDSFGYKEYGNGFKLDGKRLKLSSVGRVAVRWHRVIEGQIKTVRIARQAGKWFAAFSCAVPDPVPLEKTGTMVGIDVGLSALYTTSDGLKVDNPRWYRTSQRALKLAQRAVNRKAKGGKNRRKALRRVQRIHEQVSNQRKDFLNKLAHRLTQDHDRIAIEDLKINNMVRNHKLSKSILDAGWGYFTTRLTIKAANAGRELVFVNPTYTSKCCSTCGHEFENFSLSVRWLNCPHCGLSIDRDHNAAINILNRARNGWDTSVGVNVEASSSCVP